MLPLTLKSCLKCNKLPNLVTQDLPSWIYYTNRLNSYFEDLTILFICPYRSAQMKQKIKFFLLIYISSATSSSLWKILNTQKWMYLDAFGQKRMKKIPFNICEHFSFRTFCNCKCTAVWLKKGNWKRRRSRCTLLFKLRLSFLVPRHSVHGSLNKPI